MDTKLPYVNQPGSMVKIINKVKEAKVPDRFTQDFLATKLQFTGGNHRQFIPLAKKLGLLGSDGTPTEAYKSLRNTSTSKAAMAGALRLGYREVFERNEHADGLTKEQFKGLVVEITGLEPKNRVVQLVCQTFEALKQLADFDAKLPAEATEKKHDTDQSPPGQERPLKITGDEVDLHLSYTISLVLPKTDDPAVFNAILRALRENLLRR